MVKQAGDRSIISIVTKSERVPNTKQNLAEEEKKDIREKTASREKITRKTLERTRI